MAWIMTGDFIGLAVKVLVSGRSFNSVLLFTLANYQCLDSDIPCNISGARFCCKLKHESVSFCYLQGNKRGNYPAKCYHSLSREKVVNKWIVHICSNCTRLKVVESFFCSFFFNHASKKVLVKQKIGEYVLLKGIFWGWCKKWEEW